jgi:5-methylcytosine-specific restriction protein A
VIERLCIVGRGCDGYALPGTSRCRAHTKSNWGRGKPSAGSDYYKTPAWRERSKRQLAQEPLCARCGRRAVHADHVQNIAAGGDPDGPLQSLCGDCHRKKTSAEGHRARKRKDR